MNVNHLLTFIETITEAEEEYNISENLQSLINLTANGHSSSSNPYQNALNAFQITAGKLSDKLDNPVGMEAVSVLGLRHLIFGFYDEIRALSELYAEQTALLHERLKAIKKERSTTFAQLNTTELQLIKLGFKRDDPKTGMIDVGFIIPRTIFFNNLRSFGDELKSVDEFIKSISTVATGKALSAELISINTSNPLLWVHVDKDTAKLLIDAYKFAIEAAKDLIVAKNAFDAVRKFLPPEQIDVGKSKRDEELTELIRAEVARQIEKYGPELSADRIAETSNSMDHAYRKLIIQVEGGMQIRVRAGIEGVVEPEKLAELVDLLKSAADIVNIPAQVPLNNQITDQRLINE